MSHRILYFYVVKKFFFEACAEKALTKNRVSFVCITCKDVKECSLHLQYAYWSIKIFDYSEICTYPYCHNIFINIYYKDMPTKP